MNTYVMGLYLLLNLDDGGREAGKNSFINEKPF